MGDSLSRCHVQNAASDALERLFLDETLADELQTGSAGSTTQFFPCPALPGHVLQSPILLAHFVTRSSPVMWMPMNRCRKSVMAASNGTFSWPNLPGWNGRFVGPIVSAPEYSPKPVAMSGARRTDRTTSGRNSQPGRIGAEK